jgi:hypothetical protein
LSIIPVATENNPSTLPIGETCNQYKASSSRKQPSKRGRKLRNTRQHFFNRLLADGQHSKLTGRLYDSQFHTPINQPSNANWPPIFGYLSLHALNHVNSHRNLTICYLLRKT